MRTILYSSLALIALNSFSTADDKKQESIDAKMLIGKWKFKEEKDRYPVVVEFRANGTMTWTVQIKEERYNLPGKYRTDGNKLIIRLTMNLEHDEEYVLNKLTDTELVWTTPKEKAQWTGSRLKDK